VKTSMVVTNHRWFRCFENIDVIDVSLDVSAPLPSIVSIVPSIVVDTIARNYKKKILGYSNKYLFILTKSFGLGTKEY